MAKIEEMRTKLSAVEQALAEDMRQLVYPYGRRAAWERISRLCEIAPGSLGDGPIDNAETPIWRNKTYSGS